ARAAPRRGSGAQRGGMSIATGELSALLPDGRQTTFLQAALGDAAAAADAWRRWCGEATAGTAVATGALTPYKSLLPLLSWNLARHRIAVDPSIAPYLKFARATEKLRADRFRDICGEVFRTLED